MEELAVTYRFVFHNKEKRMKNIKSFKLNLRQHLKVTV